jgi:hypothetical protein
MNLNIRYKQAFAPVILSALLVLLLLFQTSACYAYQENSKTAVITPVYSFFSQLNNHSYSKAWSYLTSESQKDIVQSIQNSCKKDNVNISRKKISKDMKSGGGIARAYWSGYLKSFNPKIVLKYSKWKVKSIESDTAEIQINYIYSKQTAFLKVFKEKNKWKFGLTESFWARKALNKMVGTADKLF